MMMRIFPTLAALLLACAPAVAAQPDLLRPGSAEVAGDSVAERTATFDISTFEDEGWTVVGQITLRTQRAAVEGRSAVVRTETTMFDGEVAQVDSFVLDRRTLAPVVIRSDGVESSRSVQFGEGRVRTIDDGDWGADTADADLPEPVFAAGLTDLMLAALPLAEGYAARLAVYDPDSGEGVVWATVEGAEELALPGGSRAAVWRVRVADDATGGTYWLDRESRTLVRYENGGGTLRIQRAGPGPARSRPVR